MRLVHVGKVAELSSISDKITEEDIKSILQDYRQRYDRFSTHHLWCTMAAEIHDLLRLHIIITKINAERDKENRFAVNLIWDKTLARGEWWIKVSDRLRYTNRGKPLKREKFYKPVYEKRRR